MNETLKSRNAYDIATGAVINLLEQGIVPWRKPWTLAGWPKNLITGNRYRGINSILLASLNYPKNFFLTYDQVRVAGGMVRKGEEGHNVVFVKWLDREDIGTAEIQKIPLLRSYKVFNVEQCEGLSDLPMNIFKVTDPIAAAEELYMKMPGHPEIKHVDHKVYYHPCYDFINMPKRDSFKDNESYYGNLHHQMIHSTGSRNRLNRDENMFMSEFGQDSFSKEELTAEIGTCFLNTIAGINEKDSSYSVAYVQGWIERLKNDKKLIVASAAKAQRATEYILGLIVPPEQKHEAMLKHLESITA